MSSDWIKLKSFISSNMNPEFKFFCLTKSIITSVAHIVKNLPTVRETRVQSLGREDALEEEMATHSSILAWRIPGTEDPGSNYSTWGHKELDMTEQLTLNYKYTYQNKAVTFSCL